VSWRISPEWSRPGLVSQPPLKAAILAIVLSADGAGFLNRRSGVRATSGIPLPHLYLRDWRFCPFRAAPRLRQASKRPKETLQGGWGTNEPRRGRQ
jgi:hypothetical protein